MVQDTGLNLTELDVLNVFPLVAKERLKDDSQREVPAWKSCDPARLAGQRFVQQQKVRRGIYRGDQRDHRISKMSQKRSGRIGHLHAETYAAGAKS